MNAHLEDVAEPVRHKKTTTTSNIVDFTTLFLGILEMQTYFSED